MMDFTSHVTPFPQLTEANGHTFFFKDGDKAKLKVSRHFLAFVFHFKIDFNVAFFLTVDFFFNFKREGRMEPREGRKGYGERSNWKEERRVCYSLEKEGTVTRLVRNETEQTLFVHPFL